MNTTELDLSAIRRGDRITFKAWTRDGTRKATRVVTSVNGEHPWLDCFTVKSYNGWTDFAVRPHEVIEHHPQEEVA